MGPIFRKKKEKELLVTESHKWFGFLVIENEIGIISNGNNYIFLWHKILNITSTVTQNMHISKYNQRSQRDDSRIQKERNKANDFTCKLQYDVSIFSNCRQSDLTKCSLMISQCEI